METVSTIALVGIAGLLLVITARLIAAIAGDAIRAQRTRACLGERIRLLRMERMLARHDIPLGEYLHRESVSALEQRIRACESCRAGDRCDRALSAGAADAGDLGFCPNHDAWRAWRARS